MNNQHFFTYMNTQDLYELIRSSHISDATIDDHCDTTISCIIGILHSIVVMEKEDFNLNEFISKLDVACDKLSKYVAKPTSQITINRKIKHESTSFN